MEVDPLEDHDILYKQGGFHFHVGSRESTTLGTSCKMTLISTWPTQDMCLWQESCLELSRVCSLGRFGMLKPNCLSRCNLNHLLQQPGVATNVSFMFSRFPADSWLPNLCALEASSTPCTRSIGRSPLKSPYTHCRVPEGLFVRMNSSIHKTCNHRSPYTGIRHRVR